MPGRPVLIKDMAGHGDKRSLRVDIFEVSADTIGTVVAEYMVAFSGIAISVDGSIGNSVDSAWVTRISAAVFGPDTAIAILGAAMARGTIGAACAFTCTLK